MLDPRIRSMLESPCGLVVATVGGDGVPHASRGWSLRVLDPAGVRVRVILDGDDERLRAHLVEGTVLAVTGAVVRTLEGAQLKGIVRSVGTPTRTDLVHAERHTDGFFTEIAELDHIPRALLERMRPACYLACELDVTQVFEQTPGPGAGRRVDAGTT